jgi:hypothetical protein
VDHEQSSAIFLDEKRLSRRWSVSPRTIQRYRYEGKPPRWHRLNGRVLYRVSDIEAFEASCVVEREPW